jgi:hypothetical protein
MRTIIVLLLAGITIACRTSEKPIDPQLPGEYEIHGFNSGETIVLKTDGEFVYQREFRSCMGSGDVQRIRGNYSINQDNLVLNPEHLVNLKYSGSNTGDLARDSVEYYASDSTFLKTAFQIFKWDSLIYLLSEDPHSPWGYENDENDYERFSNYYNSGYEPKNSGSYFVKRSVRYLPVQKIDIATLPAKYQRRFLKEPIVAEILDVDAIEIPGDSGKTQWVNHYKLNRGRRDGVMEKMEFYGDDGCCTIRITDLDDSVSYGRIHLCFDYQAECGKGGRVTTYLERERGKFVSAR